MVTRNELFFQNALFAPRQEVVRAVYILDLDGETSRIEEIEQFSGWYFSTTPNQFGVAEAKLVCPEPWPVYYGCPSYIRLIQDNGQYVLVRRAKGEGQNTQVAVAILLKHFERLYYELGEGEGLMDFYDATSHWAAAAKRMSEAQDLEKQLKTVRAELELRSKSIEERHQKIAAEQEAWSRFKDGYEFGDWLKKNPEAAATFGIKIPQPPVPMIPTSDQLPDVMHRDYAASQGFPPRPGHGSTQTTADGAVYEFVGNQKQTWIRRGSQLPQPESCYCGHGVDRWDLHAMHCPVYRDGKRRDDVESGLPF